MSDILYMDSRQILEQQTILLQASRLLHSWSSLVKWQLMSCSGQRVIQSVPDSTNGLDTNMSKWSSELKKYLRKAFKSNIRLFTFIYNELRYLLMPFQVLLEIESKPVPPAPPTVYTIHRLRQEISQLLHCIL